MHKAKTRTPQEFEAASLEVFRILYESGRRAPANISYETYRRCGVTITVEEAAKLQEEFFEELRKTVDFRKEYDAKQAKKPKTCLYVMYAVLALEIA